MVNPTKEKKNPTTTFEDQTLDVEQFLLDFFFFFSLGRWKRFLSCRDDDIGRISFASNAVFVTGYGSLSKEPLMIPLSSGSHYCSRVVILLPFL